MKHLHLLTRAALLGAAVLAFSLPAAAAETPASLAGVTLVSAERAKSLAESGAVMIDTRAANEYAEQHIKGAKSVPYREKSVKAADFDAAQDSFDLAKLPSDKAAAVVFYCNAGECWKSYKASVVAQRAGYKTIHWMRGGIPEWKSKGLPVE